MGEYSGKQSSSTKFFQVSGVTFDGRLSAAGYSPGSGTILSLARNWLETWSVDLQTLGEDQTFCNEVSYRPQRIRTVSGQTELVATLRAVAELWRACEPSPIGIGSNLQNNNWNQPATARLFRVY